MKKFLAYLVLGVIIILTFVALTDFIVTKTEKICEKKATAILAAGRIATPALKYWVCEGVPRVNVDKTITVIFRSPGELARDIRIVNFSSRHIQKQYIMELADGYRVYLKIHDADQLRAENPANPGDYLGIREIFLPDGVTRVM